METSYKVSPVTPPTQLRGHSPLRGVNSREVLPQWTMTYAGTGPAADLPGAFVPSPPSQYVAGGTVLAPGGSHLMPAGGGYVAPPVAAVSPVHSYTPPPAAADLPGSLRVPPAQAAPPQAPPPQVLSQQGCVAGSPPGSMAWSVQHHQPPSAGNSGAWSSQQQKAQTAVLPSSTPASLGQPGSRTAAPSPATANALHQLSQQPELPGAWRGPLTAALPATLPAAATRGGVHQKINVPQLSKDSRLGLMLRGTTIVGLNNLRVSQLGFAVGQRVLAVNGVPCSTTEELSATIANQLAAGPAVFDVWSPPRQEAAARAISPMRQAASTRAISPVRQGVTTACRPSSPLRAASPLRAQGVTTACRPTSPLRLASPLRGQAVPAVVSAPAFAFGGNASLTATVPLVPAVPEGLATAATAPAVTPQASLQAPASQGCSVAVSAAQAAAMAQAAAVVQQGSSQGCSAAISAAQAAVAAQQGTALTPVAPPQPAQVWQKAGELDHSYRQVLHTTVAVPSPASDLDISHRQVLHTTVAVPGGQAATAPALSVRNPSLAGPPPRSGTGCSAGLGSLEEEAVVQQPPDSMATAGAAPPTEALPGPSPPPSGSHGAALENVSATVDVGAMLTKLEDEYEGVRLAAIEALRKRMLVSAYDGRNVSSCKEGDALALDETTQVPGANVPCTATSECTTALPTNWPPAPSGAVAAPAAEAAGKTATAPWTSAFQSHWGPTDMQSLGTTQSDVRKEADVGTAVLVGVGPGELAAGEVGGAGCGAAAFACAGRPTTLAVGAAAPPLLPSAAMAGAAPLPDAASPMTAQGSPVPRAPAPTPGSAQTLGVSPRPGFGGTGNTLGCDPALPASWEMPGTAPASSRTLCGWEAAFGEAQRQVARMAEQAARAQANAALAGGWAEEVSPTAAAAQAVRAQASAALASSWAEEVSAEATPVQASFGAPSIGGPEDGEQTEAALTEAQRQVARMAAQAHRDGWLPELAQQQVARMAQQAATLDLQEGMEPMH